MHLFAKDVSRYGQHLEHNLSLHKIQPAVTPLRANDCFMDIWNLSHQYSLTISLWLSRGTRTGRANYWGVLPRIFIFQGTFPYCIVVWSGESFSSTWYAGTRNPCGFSLSRRHYISRGRSSCPGFLGLSFQSFSHLNAFWSTILLDRSCRSTGFIIRSWRSGSS